MFLELGILEVKLNKGHAQHILSRNRNINTSVFRHLSFGACSALHNHTHLGYRSMEVVSVDCTASHGVYEITQCAARCLHNVTTVVQNNCDL